MQEKYKRKIIRNSINSQRRKENRKAIRKIIRRIARRSRLLLSPRWKKRMNKKVRRMFVGRKTN